jgi:H+/gluconate symporter-like permease
LAVKRVTAAAPVLAVERVEGRPKPGFGVTLFVICLPVVLMLLATGAELWGHGYPAVFGFLTAVGHPVFALALAWLLLDQVIAPVQVLGALIVVTTVIALGLRKQAS